MKTTFSISPTLDQILDFTYCYPSACFHTVDMPYRLCSPAAQDPANSRLWTDAEDEVLGFDLVQLPFSTLDWATRPGDEQLHDEIVAWGVARLEEVAGQRSGGLGFLLDSRSDRDPVAARNSFELDDWYIRNLAMKFMSSPLVPSTPSGFYIHPLNGEAEVAAYVALHRAAFQTRNMSSDWRTRILFHPRYQPQLDLIAEAADGRLAAFCIGWLDESDGDVVGQIEPVGVLPEFQGQGLGRAILLESLQRFYEVGAKRVLIDAESNNPASQHLYEAVGFREFNRTYKYFRRF
jgi:ribosomal protein S18 acetylase RimI-like enzyme